MALLSIPVWLSICKLLKPYLLDHSVVITNAAAKGEACGCRVQFSPWVTLQTTVGVTVKGAEVTDVYGNTFPTYTNTSTIDHRYALHMNAGFCAVGPPTPQPTPLGPMAYRACKTTQLLYYSLDSYD